MVVATEALERQLEAIRALRSGTERLRTVKPPPEMADRWRGAAQNEARHWANEIRLLEGATPFFWTRETTAAVLAIAPVFDLSEIACHRELLFCDVAFCWFEDSPFDIQMRSGGADHIRGLTWAYALERQSRVAMITFTVYTFRDGMPVPVTWASVDVGQTLDRFGAPNDASDATAAEFDRWRGQCQQIARFIVCAGAFLRQKLAVVEQTRAVRHARKRIAAAGWTGEPVVSVVHLREREKRAATADAETVAAGDRTYRYQWIVQAHTRQQWYPSLETHLPILIGPYIKGPEDKPLKPRTTPIFLVDR